MSSATNDMCQYQCLPLYQNIQSSIKPFLVYIIDNKQQVMTEEKSQYHVFYELSQASKHLDQDSNINLRHVSQQIDKYHKDIMQQIDRDQRLQQLQHNITTNINNMASQFKYRFETMNRIIEQLTVKLGLQRGRTKESIRIQESPLVKKLQDKSYNYEDIIENSQILNIWSQEDQRKTQPEPVYHVGPIQQIETTQFIEIVDEEEQTDEEELLFDPSNLLQHLSATFSQMELKFTKCTLVYQFPYMKFIDFHNKIDNQENIFFLAQLQNDQVIGAFSHLCFNPTPNYIPKENSKSFICNLTKDIYAFAYRINKTHTHDPNYLIFGNWEIKVKREEDILQTNWGTNGDCFSLKKYGQKQLLTMKTQEFFGQGAQRKNLKIRRYNFYVFS